MEFYRYPCGYMLYASDLMADTVWTQVRFPRSKKRRIRKKWTKDRRNWRSRLVPWDKAFVLRDGTVVAHPTIVAELERAARKINEDLLGKILDTPPPLAFATFPGPSLGPSSFSLDSQAIRDDLFKSLGVPERLIRGHAMYVAPIVF